MVTTPMSAKTKWLIDTGLAELSCLSRRSSFSLIKIRVPRLSSRIKTTKGFMLKISPVVRTKNLNRINQTRKLSISTIKKVSQ